jgi:threonine/homoserine/homoserine lactone efflux protein
MLSPDTLIPFLSTSFLLAITPGPDNVYVLTQSALHNWRIGLFITLGLCTGLLLHSFAIAYGLSALIIASPFAFSAVKLAGIAYLIYLAWLAFHAKSLSLQEQSQSILSYGQFYRRGILMNISNPKVALFFMAFLPQFVDLTEANTRPQLLLLSALFIIIAFIVMTTIAIISGALRHWLISSPKAQKSMYNITGIVLFGLALHIAFLMP